MYGDHKTYAAKSTDMGKTWTAFKCKDFTSFAHKIKEDPINKNLLFLGTEMGLFATLNGGDNWFKMKNNIPEFALVRDIQIHPKTHDLIVGTHGRGIYILDDIRAIRNLTSEITSQEVHLFETPDMVLNNGKFGWGGPEVSGGWGSGNAPETPTIDYYLKDRVSTGKATLQILDDKGNLVQEMPATIRKGINKVYWNLRGTPPKVAKGSTKMDGAGFTAPMVLPGVYTAKLKIGDKVYTTTLNCVHDNANKDLTPADRKLVFDKAMNLQKMYARLGVVVDSITEAQTKLKSDTVAYKKSRSNQQLVADLEKIRAELMATKQTSMFADEEKVRERISELYGTFCEMESKPNATQIQAIQDLELQLVEQENAFRKLKNKSTGMLIY